MIEDRIYSRQKGNQLTNQDKQSQNGNSLASKDGQSMCIIIRGIFSVHSGYCWASFCSVLTATKQSSEALNTSQDEGGRRAESKTTRNNRKVT